MLKIGAPAPDFTLFDADMESVKLSKLHGKCVVLFFYPKDDTPTCTSEAIEFSDLDNEFAKYNTVVIGISRDDCISHAEFRDKHGLTVNLLADSEGKVCEKYGVIQEKENEGIKKICLVRSTFVIDSKGILRHMQYCVGTKGHAHEILELIKNNHIQ